MQCYVRNLKNRHDMMLFIFHHPQYVSYTVYNIIATHSPFLLALEGAKIYDLDSLNGDVKAWNELDNIRLYYEFFKEHEQEFDA